MGAENAGFMSRGARFMVANRRVFAKGYAHAYDLQ